MAAPVAVCAPWQVALGRALRVRVTAISVNCVAPEGQGWTASGIVEAVGPDVTLFRPADRVWYAATTALPGMPSTLHLVDERIAASAAPPPLIVE